MDALRGALDEALAGKYEAFENRTASAAVIQEWHFLPHSILAIAQSGSDGDIRRAVENYRGMGTPTMTGIIGGTPDNTSLDSVSNGTVEWDGTNYTGLDLRPANTSEAKATALTTLLDGTGVTVRSIDGIYIAMFGWQPTYNAYVWHWHGDNELWACTCRIILPTGAFHSPTRTRA